ncbi:MCE family protein [Maricaulaceae bacterium EIL42A08]|nr:MCE family protein [Maricaulaceae bacterium EIL42A08]
METKAHHALVGFFVVFLLAAGSVFLLWLANVSIDQEFEEYDVVFDGPVRGLRTASEVRFNGIQVGEVTELGLNPENPGEVIARIRVDAATPVKADSVAQLEPQGLTGLSYIQLASGSPEAPLLESRLGDRAPRIYADPAQLEQLFAGGETALESAQLAFARASALLSEENVANFSELLANSREISQSLSEQEQLVTDVRAAIASLQQAGNDISTAAAGVEQFASTTEAFLLNEVGPMVDDVSAASISVDLASRETYDALVTIRPAVEEFAEDGLGELSAASRDLRSLIAALERITLELEQDPAGFISQSAGEEVEVPQ